MALTIVCYPESGLEVAQLHGLLQAQSAQGAALIDQAHALLGRVHPEYQHYEDLPVWHDRLSEKRIGDAYLPDLQLSAVCEHLGDPQRGRILGFSYSEYHPDSQAGQTVYNVIAPDTDHETVGGLLRRHQLEALHRRAGEKGQTLKGLFEERRADEATIWPDATAVNLDYVQPSFLPYEEREGHAPGRSESATGFRLYSCPVAASLSAETLDAFLADMHRYMTTQEVEHSTDPAIAAMFGQAEAMKRGERPIMAAPASLLKAGEPRAGERLDPGGRVRA